MTDHERKVLSGHVTAQTIPIPPPGIVRVFVCSAGSDTVQERNALVENVYPSVRDYCREKYGLEFQAVDFHWGNLKNRYPDNHSNGAFFRREIRRCQDLSEGPNFLLLCGQKRGSCSLPASIRDEEFRHLRHALKRHKGRQNRNYGFLEQWYELNENALPNTYILTPVSSNIPEYLDKDESVRREGQKKWAESEAELRRLLRRASDLCHADGVFDLDTKNKYHMSDLESQTYYGIETIPHPDEKCLVVYRNIIDLKNHTNEERTREYAELTYNEKLDRLEIDPDIQKQLTALKTKLDSVLPKENRANFDVLWRDDEVINPNLHREYLDNFCATVQERLVALVDRVSSKRGRDQGSEIFQVVYQHWLRCRGLAESHRGREDVLAKINQYLQGTSVEPLVLHGIAGAGKTSLMSKCALEAQNTFSSPVITVTRYIGYTPKSSNLRQLLVSLCSQLAFALGGDLSNIPTDCGELVKLLHQILDSVPADHRLLIFLDDVSQIRPDFNAHDFSWLPTNLKTNVRVVISTRTENGGLLERLTDHVIKERDNFLEVTALSAAEAYNLLLHFFSKNNAAVTENQRETLSHALHKCSLPLYVKILADFVCKDWVSSMKVRLEILPLTLPDSLNFVFNSLEKTFGQVAVARSLGYLYASGTGLSDCEMEDILSLDDKVLSEVSAGQHPPLRRVPSSLWIYMKDTFAPFLSSKEHDGVTVNFLSHEIFNEFVKDQYLCDEKTVKDMHSLLADYFLGYWANKAKPFGLHSSSVIALEGDVLVEADRLVPAQPHTFHDQSGVTRYNRRKYDQVPKHLFCSGRLEELDRLVLFNYDWIYNKTKALSLEQIILDLTLNPSKETMLVSDCLRLSQAVVENNINNLAAELTGHLLPHYRSYPNISQLINTCDRRALKHNALMPVFPYHKITGSSLNYTLESRGPIDQCFLSADGSSLLAKGRESAKVYVCDSVSGATKDTLLTSTGQVHVTPNGEYLVIVDHITEKTVKVHKGATGQFVDQLVVMNHIDLKPREKYHMGPVCVSNHRVCLVVSTDKSYLCIAELPGCRFLQIVELESRTSICSMTPDAAYVFCNSGPYMLTYNLFTLEHTATTSLMQSPTSIAFTHDSQRCYLSNQTENKLTVMHLQGGKIELVYKAVLEEWMEGDKVAELKVSPNDSVVAIKGSNNILVYHRKDEQVIAHFPRPTEALEEFRLPMSQYEEMHFTRVAFSGDSSCLFGTLFRNIYMWEISSGNLLTTIQTPPGVIQTLLVSPQHGHLYTLIQGYSAVQCWNIDEITNKVDPLDQLSDSVTDIRVMADQSRAFVTSSSGEEIAVVEMDFGTILDLLTHESKIEDFAVSPSGDFILVSTKPKWSNCTVKLWDLDNREIVSEFGNTSGYCVSYNKENVLLLLCQRDNTFKAPFQITKFSCFCGQFQTTVFDLEIPFLLSRPFVTADDCHLVMFTAQDYMGSKGMYDTPEITVVDLKCQKVVNVFTPEKYQPITNMVAILDVRASPFDPKLLAIIYLSEGHSGSRENGQLVCPQYGFLVTDIRHGSIRAMCEPFISPEIPINNNILIAKDFSFVVDGSSNIFDCATMSYKRRVPGCSTIPRLLALGGKALVFAESSLLKVVRLDDMKTIVSCETHSGITTLTLCADDRTLVVGCQDGTILCYVIVDPESDDCESVLSKLPSRQVGSALENSASSRRSSRVWDKVSWEENVPGYSRPPSAKSTGPSQRDLLERVKPVARTRPTSDTFLYMNHKSVTCAVM